MIWVCFVYERLKKTAMDNLELHTNRVICRYDEHELDAILFLYIYEIYA